MSEQNTAKKSENTQKISVTISEIIHSHYAQSSTGMTQKEVVTAILKKKGSTNLLEDYPKMQPNVSKALKTLIKRKAVTRTDDNTYVPYDANYLRGDLSDQLSEKVTFTKSEAFAISENTLLLGVDIHCVTVAIDLLKMYLGENRYFDIIFVNGYVVVMLRSEDNKEIREKLNLIIKKSNEIREKEQKKRLKKKEDKTKSEEVASSQQ